MSALLLLLLLAVEPHRLDSRREPGAQSCPDEQAVQRAVAERLGMNPFAPDAVRTVTLRWKSSGGLFSARLEVIDEAGATIGSRSLSSSDCTELASSAALALALILDPMSLTRAPAAPEAEAPPPPPPAAPAPPSPPLVVLEPAQAPPPPRSETSLWLGGGAAVSYGDVPQVTAALELELAWKWRWLWLGVRGAFVAPASTKIDVGSVSALLFGAGPFFCAGSSRFGGCVSTRLGTLHAWPSGFTTPSSPATAFSFAAGLGPYVDFAPSPSMKLRVFLTGLVQPTPAVLVVKTLEAWRSPIFSLNAGVGVRWAAMGSDVDP